MKRLKLVGLVTIILTFSCCGKANALTGNYYYSENQAIVTDTPATKKINLFKALKKYSKKTTVLAKFLRSILAVDQKTGIKDSPVIVSEKRFSNQQHKYIRKIVIIVLGPFGYSVNEKFGHDINKLQRLGDNIHYPTRNWVIRENLLFKTGETVDGLKVAESERLIRQTPYVVDARISFDPVSGASDSLDAIVIVQDVFNFTAGASGDPTRPNGDLTVTDINFLGLGQRFYNKIWYDEQYAQDYKYSGSYSVPQIANTYVSGEMHYNSINYDNKGGLSFSRPFYSKITKWAGGLDLEYTHESYNLTLADNQLYQGYHNYSTQDFWLGYSFMLSDKLFNKLHKSQLVISGRTFHINYFNQAAYPDNLNHVFHNNTTYLAAVGITNREYYKDHHILGFGKTEDVPFGYLFSITSGPDIGQFYNRWYSGAKLAYGIYFNNIGYTYFSMEYGGYLKGNHFEQAVLNTQVFYFSNLICIGDWEMRHYIKNRYTLGINRNPGEILHINGSDGLQRFNAPMVSGTQRWVNNYEADFFSSWTPLGFHIVLVFYMDDAFLQPEGESIFRSRLYQGYGLGIRFKNEHFIFDAFELSFRIFPNGTAFGGNAWKYVGTGIPAMQFQDFQFSEPYIAPYN